MWKKFWNNSRAIGGTSRRVFLDYASATYVRREVRDAMDAYSSAHFANPSALYREARQSAEVLTKARADVGRALNSAKENIYFTSGGTEGNNIAILGVFEAAKKYSQKNSHIISVATEHPSVREVLDEAAHRGADITLLTPNTDGLISAQQVKDVLRPETILVSVMYVNNEIGVVQPVREIAQVVKEYRMQKTPDTAATTAAYPYMHVDACQAPLLYGLDVSTLGADLLTLDGLKMYGPAGIGCLYVRPSLKSGGHISPVMFGGGQEKGLRSGTENVASIVGFATALTLARAEYKQLTERVLPLREYFIDQILKKFPNTELNGSRTHRSPNNVNVCFKNANGKPIDAEYLVVALDTYGVSASYSSSCRTLKEDSSSYIVESLGKPDCALSSIRFTLGRDTTKSDLDRALVALEKAIAQVTK